MLTVPLVELDERARVAALRDIGPRAARYTDYVRDKAPAQKINAYVNEHLGEELGCFAWAGYDMIIEFLTQNRNPEDPSCLS